MAISNMTMPGTTYGLAASNNRLNTINTTYAPSQALLGTKPIRRSISVFQKRIRDLKTDDGEEKTKGLYRPIFTSSIIDKLGNYNPVYGGDLKRDIAPLVYGICSEKRRVSPSYYISGLMYRTPPIAGKRGMRYRTSIGGLDLICHWRDKFPGFRRFFDCYWNEKADKLIREECAQLAWGSLPERFEAMNEAHEKQLGIIARKENAELKKQIALQQAYSTTNMPGGYYSWNDSTGWSQTQNLQSLQLQQAQYTAAYNAALKNSK